MIIQWGPSNRHLASWNLPDSQFCLEFKIEPCVTKAQNYIGWGNPHRKIVYLMGGHRIYLFDESTIGVGALHNIERKSCLGSSKLDHKAPLWLHRASWNLPDTQLSWKCKLEPRISGGRASYIPIWDIWSGVQTRVGTPHKIQRCLRSKGGSDTAHSNWGYLVWCLN